MKIISTGAADILLVDYRPADARSFDIEFNPALNNFQLYWLADFMGLRDVRQCRDLPEGYNYTILDVADKMTEEQWALILPNYGGKIFDYDPKHYNSYPDYEFANHPFESKFFDTATESGHSLLKAHGILLVNPHEHPIYKGTMGEELFIHLESEYEEAQSKVKNPLVIKAEKIT